MRLLPVIAAHLLALALAGCASTEGIGSWLERTPGAQSYTGKGEMGTGTDGNNNGFGGPSQTPGFPEKPVRGAPR